MSSTILITGASKGLGLCLAETFAKSGWEVIATRREATERLVALVNDHPDQVVDIDMDVTDAAAISNARRQVTERFSKIDVLVNNAAILPPEGRGQLGQMNYAAGLRVFDVNALGPMRVTEAFLSLLEGGRRKLIVNVSSEAGSIADCWRKDEYFYCMSKAALNMQTAILRNFLGERGIELLAVHPGWMRTDMGGANADIDPSEAAQGIFSLVAQPRSPQEGYYCDYRGKQMRF